MKISGLQKLTLLDYPGHLAALIFLEGCNFRCPFCQNSSLVLPSGSDASHAPGVRNIPNDPAAVHLPENPDIPRDEIFSFLKKRAGILDGVCISGGEPTIHRELPDFIRKIRSLGYLVKLDTNGTNPQMLKMLLDEELLDYVAMDIKTGRRNYAAVAGIEHDTKYTGHSPDTQNPDRENFMPQYSPLLDAVSQSVSLLMNGSIDYEFRTTVVRGLHTAADFEDIAVWLEGCSGYFLQSFRDCDTVLLPNHPFSAFSTAELMRFLEIVQKKIPRASIRGIDN